MTRLGRSRSGIDSVLATTRDGAPILVTQNYGQGRELAFGGDTTHRWVRSPRLLQMHGRFWRQMAVWLAKRRGPKSGRRLVARMLLRSIYKMLREGVTFTPELATRP